MTKLDQDFTMWQGETISLRVPVTDSAGDPVTLTGATVTWKATAGAAVLTKSGSVISIDAADDGVQIDLDPADTTALTPKKYAHECRVVDAGGDHNVIFVGDLVLRLSSTKPA